mmetsp:Transcript_85442/g.242230  ORF Transcript_85442/g.242230 Transcript_85442/m.242230 type:complete len:128 (-) Transcript_85442:79-462(-)
MMLGTMLARAYYMPGTVEVVQTLLGMDDFGEPPQSNRALLWQIIVPRKRNGKVYKLWGELWRDLFSGEHFESVIALGLYRTPGSHGTGYVVTHPAEDLRVRLSDLVFVLASGAWSRWATEAGLLPRT